MNRTNYQRELDALIKTLAERPRLLLHSCCAPCSSYVLEYLAPYFRLELFYYNPNIAPEQEYQKRLWEQKKLAERLQIPVLEEAYRPQDFYDMARGMEDAPEGGIRCKACYRLRLRKTAQLARERGVDYFCTTLSISPLKDAQAINVIGREEGEQAGVRWLPSDFKKRGGYQRSIELAREYGLYRQNYCGCLFSRREET
ncbi:epoxyqueuosine reductase QueH [Christensenella sp. MSJ-20]|uniref:epoxyqueuosine reductase QueH n=1 Tax=Christensenella sp. MSJ-20 TaxID=2841518 RepID=UPI000D7AF530|nr:MAG: recombinase [Bacillota bacterium]QWT54849.1 epoxyqueuosine reductase QueH [Christensenella sp. MSJ-20]